LTNSAVALLAFKLFALCRMANAAMVAAAVPLLWWDPEFDKVRSATVFYALVPVLIAIGIGVPVWFSADWFAARIFRDVSPPLRLDQLRGEPLVALASSVIGLYFAADSLPVLVNGAALFTQSRSTGSAFLGPDVEQQRLIWGASAKANVAAGVARFLIGLALMAGPVRLARALARMRKELSGDLGGTGEGPPDRPVPG
jgi:hypothetical protein